MSVFNIVQDARDYIGENSASNFVEVSAACFDGWAAINNISMVNENVIAMVPVTGGGNDFIPTIYIGTEHLRAIRYAPTGARYA